MLDRDPRCVERGPERRGLITIGTTARDDRVVITVADTGGGIPPAIRARVFEPFFTTKAPGRGCGIGLALAPSLDGVQVELRLVTAGALTIEVDRRPAPPTAEAPSPSPVR